MALEHPNTRACLSISRSRSRVAIDRINPRAVGFHPCRARISLDGTRTYLHIEHDDRASDLADQQNVGGSRGLGERISEMVHLQAPTTLYAHQSATLDNELALSLSRSRYLEAPHAYQPRREATREHVWRRALATRRRHRHRHRVHRVARAAAMTASDRALQRRRRSRVARRRRRRHGRRRLGQQRRHRVARVRRRQRLAQQRRRRLGLLPYVCSVVYLVTNLPSCAIRKLCVPSLPSASS